MTVRYPAGPLTPHGWWHITNDTRPMMRLRAYDGSIDTYLLGGLAPPYNDPTEPEAAALKSLKGLIAPWQHIDQKGATEDGVTNIDTLYDPAEVEAVLDFIGRDPKSLRRVVRDVIGSIDAKKQSELSWLTHELGYWWSPVRWFKGAPPDPLRNPQVHRQQLSLRLRADSGFWRSYDDTAAFSYDYPVLDDFDVANTEDLRFPLTIPYTFGDGISDDLPMGLQWPVYFYPDGGAGFAYITGDAAAWAPSGTAAHGVVIGPLKDYTTTTDNQVVEIELGAVPDIVYPEGAYNDILARMDVSAGVWGGNGICARIGRLGDAGWVELSRFNAFTKTVLYSQPIGIRPGPGERFRLVCGTSSDPRLFKILRNGLPVLAHKEVGTNSHLGASYRGVGLGMRAGTGQVLPAWVRSISAGDNTPGNRSGFLARTNIGDQDMYDDYTAFGPFTKLKLYDGPGSTSFVEFGPLLENQAALLRTDPRDRNVYDLATVKAIPNQQERGIFEAALGGLLSFATAGNSNPIIAITQSLFGIFGGGSAPALPQGNMYALLHGRFSDHSKIPAKSPGNPATSYHVKIEVEGGDAGTLVIASGTPLRRYPI